jgi:hypothetical protein
MEGQVLPDAALQDAAPGSRPCWAPSAGSQQVAELKDRVQERDEELATLRQFKILAVSRIAAQHEELERLRRQLKSPSKVRQLRPDE